MMRWKNKLVIFVVVPIYALVTLFCLLKPADAYSASERRKLAQKPKFSWETLWSGEYIARAEEYVVDQFPFRDGFRSLKAYFSLGVMQRQDTNGIYVKDGYLCEMEYPMDEASIERACGIFEKIYEEHIKGTDANAYISIVPDKNYYLAEENILSMDYDLFFESIYENTSFLQPIEINNTLALNDYFRTDSHWKQECIMDTAQMLAEEMGTPFSKDFKVRKIEEPFYGVYYGQAGLRVPADDIYYCINENLEKCRVYDHENKKEISLYDLSKAGGRDPYEMFMGGNVSLVTVENEEALSSKELIVFGDSFSRSLLPLFAGSYQKITLVDIRYLPSTYIKEYVEITDQDVLFLYSTSVLNNSITLK